MPSFRIDSVGAAARPLRTKWSAQLLGPSTQRLDEHPEPVRTRCQHPPHTAPSLVTGSPAFAGGQSPHRIPPWLPSRTA